MYRSDTGTFSHSPNGVNVHSDLFRPCGYCMACRMTKAQDWAIRMTHEAQLHEQSSFLTLTYSDDNLPLTFKDDIPVLGSLHYPDVSAFMKRLRKRLSVTRYKDSLSFYRVGEYGDNLQRPHYHLILFGFDFREPLTYHGVQNSRTFKFASDDRRYDKSSFADSAWSLGFVDVGDVDYSTTMYVAKYVTKKLFGAQSSRYGFLEPEKASMSKKNPIGSRWISKYFEDVYPHDYVVLNNKKLPPPKFYDRWLEANKPSLYTKVKAQREESMKDSFPDIQQLYNSHFIRLEKQKSFLRDGCAPNTLVDKVMLERKLDFITNHKEFL